ncbi:hypothetical protein TIFTF001_039603 [Ficus carica]|uniref:Uncharacterized protein n=1 Tax=Ficus carica TaxID=3494 RepID=A0AA88EFI7_FICCA|nr:hypothetical protein TIFTF001_039603 [Ficus carica]
MGVRIGLGDRVSGQSSGFRFSGFETRTRSGSRSRSGIGVGDEVGFWGKGLGRGRISKRGSGPGFEMRVGLGFWVGVVGRGRDQVSVLKRTQP